MNKKVNEKKDFKRIKENITGTIKNKSEWFIWTKLIFAFVEKTLKTLIIKKGIIKNSCLRSINLKSLEETL